MTSPLWTDAAEYRAGRPLCLLVGYDGVLAPSDPSRLAAEPSPAVRGALAALATAPRVSVGVLSGRVLGSLRELTAVPGVRYAASGGMHLDLGDREVVHPARAGFDDIADALLTALSATLRWFPGTWAERAPGRLTLRYRPLAAINALDFVTEVRETLDALGPDCPPLRVRDADRALEVTLADAPTGADAVDRLVEAAPAGSAVVLAVGAGEAEAAARVTERGGAVVRVTGPAEFEAGLLRLAAEIAGPMPTPAGSPRPAEPGALPTAIRWA